MSLHRNQVEDIAAQIAAQINGLDAEVQTYLWRHNVDAEKKLKELD